MSQSIKPDACPRDSKTQEGGCTVSLLSEPWVPRSSLSIEMEATDLHLRGWDPASHHCGGSGGRKTHPVSGGDLSPYAATTFLGHQTDQPDTEREAGQNLHQEFCARGPSLTKAVNAHPGILQNRRGLLGLMPALVRTPPLSLIPQPQWAPLWGVRGWTSDRSTATMSCFCA